MLPLRLDLGARRPRIVALGAHPDDIEIGCGGTLLRLAEAAPGLSAEFVVATGSAARLAEAKLATGLFLPGCEVDLRTGELPDGRLPANWNALKELLEAAAGAGPADIVLAPSLVDAHQDHRLLAELATTVWRDHLVLRYEIPKWDGDLSRPSLYVRLTGEQMQQKVERLHKAYPSQAGREWFDDDVFRGLARLRGVECRARYAEAFTTTKGVLTW
jgi:LmbE family N-acetylglucosaminyl deacetylase